MSGWIAAALLWGAAVQDIRTSTDVPLFVRAEQKALDNLDRMPDYVCTQTVDSASFEVAFIGGKVLYRRHGARSFNAKTPAAVAGGMPNAGPFGSYIRTIFNDATRVRYAGEENMGGRRLGRFEFEAPPFPRGITLGAKTTGSRGSFWADSEDGDIVLLELHAVGLRALDRVAYAPVLLGGRRFTLPSAAESEMNGARRASKFSACRALEK
jgi:hypothetical protein